MSGGSYNYAYSRVEDMASEMKMRHATQPTILAFATHLERVAEAMRAVEWADSSDTTWDNDLYAQLRSFNGGNAESLEAVKIAANLRDALNAMPLPPKGAK